MAGDPRLLVRPAPPVVELVWIPCYGCCGQRVVWRQTPAGLKPSACRVCEGMGERLTRA